MKTPGLLYIAAIAVLCPACAGDGQQSDQQVTADRLITSEKASFRIDTLRTGLENPWGMVWLPDGRVLVTERKGEILALGNDPGKTEKLKGFPEVYERGQGGLMDIQLHPYYAKNGWIYVTYARPGKEGGSTTLARFRLTGNEIIDFEALYQTTPLSTSGVHFGSRIVFDEAGYLYFSTGERGIKANAQDLTNDMGKIHRLHDDGRIPSDNPFIDHPAAKPSIWSYGHRNIQGMAYDPVNRILYATEHGPRGGDELNIIEKGKNYGWPIITYGIDYSGAIISELTTKEGMEQPIHYWTPSIATCGLLYYTGNRYTDWQGNLFSGALAQTHIARIEVTNGIYKHEERLLAGIGRVRHIAQDTDGFITVLTEGPGILLKLVPAE
ncbi:Glucose/arabinose dehydrogenase, beta-propeller fold [Parapedobacter luteus]|uniref:Glucose/arabinose dehydrogenase, beta-propeller fold n=1 Tax=Parapedobacter luteus TaxID=623280 RepID=A0A1T5APF7_9SPHI|nr:PQQ-dependent sugar dehydrogenase [Parapedobacter luteus]SKB36941.1 Glucose/arabinose dehydrogenase, beta-propeller fold [Parapedobacter luteus]